MKGLLAKWKYNHKEWCYARIDTHDRVQASVWTKEAGNADCITTDEDDGYDPRKGSARWRIEEVDIDGASYYYNCNVASDIKTAKKKVDDILLKLGWELSD